MLNLFKKELRFFLLTFFLIAIPAEICFSQGDINAIETIEIAQVDNVKIEDLTADQLTVLLETIQNSHHKIAAGMMLTALYSGMRRGEMFKLQWKDVDFNKNFMGIFARNLKKLRQYSAFIISHTLKR